MLQGEYSAILSTFIKLPLLIKIFVLSIFELHLGQVFTVGDDQTELMCKMVYAYVIHMKQKQVSSSLYSYKGE